MSDADLELVGRWINGITSAYRRATKKEAVRGEPRTANLTGPRAVVSQRPATLVLRRQSHENYVYFFTLKKAEMVEPSLAVITAR